MKFLYCIISFAAGILIGLGPAMLVAEPVMLKELRITESSAAIGMFNESSSDQQLYSYSFLLYNGRDQSLQIDTVEPVFGAGISSRIITENTSLDINRTVGPDSSITVEGQVVVDITGLTKEDIFGFEPFIDHVVVRSTEIVDHP
ncbi:MAG: hypothetical protein Q8J68_00055 [Methanolobus sp.]|uniref:hypothetical protein n=1 Tax=Methanolobus sp. TaxID=1874737 RepID=UPI00273226DC|nr:hypothetical protein [Methanolobus sp.]MDP2215673.1 hypothetical protein [Methanolobus sp.]